LDEDTCDGEEAPHNVHKNLRGAYPLDPLEIPMAIYP